MVRAYIDNTMVITKNYITEHLKALDKVLQKIVKAELKVNS